MPGVNKVILVGRLGRDPEVRNFSNGGKVVNLRLATSERYKDRDGNQQERTEWHSVAIFNEKLGEIAEKYLQKGSEVFIEGALETRKFTDQAGVEKYTTEIVLRQFRGEIALLGGKRDGAGGDGEGAGSGETRGGGGYGGGNTASAGGGYGRANKPAGGGGWDNGGTRGPARGGPPKGGDDMDDIPFGLEWR